MDLFGSLEFWELLSYVVTVFGLPFALWAYMAEQRRERQGEEEELYQKLSDEYASFSRLLLENADLKLGTQNFREEQFNEEQRERKRIIFEILISLFERAFILVYEEKMSPQTRRLWLSWDDYMRFWCRRTDFRSVLDELLQGEDPDFGVYIKRIAHEVSEEIVLRNTLKDPS